MIISTSLLKSAIDKYRAAKKRENYNDWDAASQGASAAFNAFLVVIAMIFFVLELVLLFYAILIALNCTKAGAERIVHIVLAVIFTLPYMLLSVLFNPCAKSTLVNTKIFSK